MKFVTVLNPNMLLSTETTELCFLWYMMNNQQYRVFMIIIGKLQNKVKLGKDIFIVLPTYYAGRAQNVTVNSTGCGLDPN